MLKSIRILLTGAVCLFGRCNSAATTKLLYQFPSVPHESPENVALRPNGDLLVTTTSSAVVYLINPNESTSSAQVACKFPTGNATLGIVETQNDVFAVNVGDVNIATRGGTLGSFSVWSVDFSSGSDTPTCKEIAAVPQANILNGMSHLPSAPNVVLSVDSESGDVYSIDTTTGAVSVAIQSSSFGSGVGLNGIRADAPGDKLYFTNSATGAFGYIPIDQSGQATGSATTLNKDNAAGYTFDDFALDGQGNAYITNHPDAITEITVSGQESTIYNNTNLNQPTSAVFGYDGQTLYVVTAGSITPQDMSGQIFSITM